MDRPRLRPLEAFPLAKNGQKLLGLRDPSRLTDAVATLPPGRRRHRPALRRRIDARRDLRRVPAPLRHAAAARGARQADRPARPGLPARLRSLPPVLGDRVRRLRPVAHAQGAPRRRELPRRRRRSSPRSSTATSIRRTAPAARRPERRRLAARHRRAAHRLRPRWRRLRLGLQAARRGRPLPELVVVFGTDHMGAEQPFTLTRKHYETPVRPHAHRRRARRRAGQQGRRAPRRAARAGALQATSTTTAASTRSSSRWSGCATSGRTAPTPSRLSPSCAARCTTSSRAARARAPTRASTPCSRRSSSSSARARPCGSPAPIWRTSARASATASRSTPAIALARAPRPGDAGPRQPRRRRRLVRRDPKGARSPPRLRPAADLRHARVGPPRRRPRRRLRAVPRRRRWRLDRLDCFTRLRLIV